MKNQEKIAEKLQLIYGEQYNTSMLEQTLAILEKWKSKTWPNKTEISEKNVYLITYGDAIYKKQEKPLKTLNTFLQNEVGSIISDIHILPMFPYTSDDGFSVVDYRAIDTNLGNWDDITNLAKNYRIMYDFVTNHISKSSQWFQGYLNEDEKYQNYFIAEDINFDSSQVIRPRTSPLFHKYTCPNGKIKTAWTTFSEDQVDLNFKHFPLLLEMSDILLEYAFSGASSIRLDAIGFMWKNSGTSCLHLTETHEIIKLWRILLDEVSPATQIITETNVPHVENISYFGKNLDEAHMVYQFALPPLVLFSFATANATKLSNWAKTINKVGKHATYFNFLSSHDGIGLRPTEGILNDDERQILVDKVLENGGKVSYKNNVDGSKSVYEMNINYGDALMSKTDNTLELQVAKYLAAHSILLAMVGVPAIYYHTLLGSRNDYNGLEQSGINRRINREKLEYTKLTADIKENHYRQQIFNNFKKMIELRKEQVAFSPFGEQTILELGENIFAIKREHAEKTIVAIVNVSNQKLSLESNIVGEDIVSEETINKTIKLEPYQYRWIKL